ncbi:MAG: ComF family protein [Nevskiales bacterium]|nr:ComF family protein [Nevskiales bacterium]
MKPLFRLLAPERCHWCRTPLHGRPVCAACEASLPWNTSACRACAQPLISVAGTTVAVCTNCLNHAPPQDRSWTAFRYEAPVTQQILNLKFHGRLAPAHVLGTLMASKLATRPQPLPELLIPVPLHSARLRRRGYNQAMEIARALSRRLSIPMPAGTAERIRPTREQTELSAVDRRHNVKGAFTVNPIARGRHIALLDDVITTGATLAELARAARKAGAVHIEAWAVARA